MMRKVSEDSRLAYTRLPAYLDRNAGVECREKGRQLRLPAEQTTNQPRTEENRSRAGTGVRPLCAWALADQGAVRLADVHDIPTDGYLTGDRAAHRRFPNVRVHTRCSR